ncbi:MAG: hypothetical protein HY791_10180 [Deltaproteobacteria bacterium]|nr:hypothetical protein [Deltaproteobacteria bacterium]
MMFSHAAHLIVLGLWGGLVTAEAIVELVGRRDVRLAYAVARFHYWIDLVAELPLLGAVVATGLILLAQTTLDAFLWAKVACGGVAVIANLACVLIVVKRWRVATRTGEVPDRLSAWVLRLAALGVPAGAAALVLGGRRVGWW